MSRARKAVLFPLLEVLRTLKPEQRVILMSHFSDSTRDHIYETISRVLNSDRIPRRKRISLRDKLKPYARQMRYLADSKKSARRKKKVLSQVGAGPMGHVLKVTVPMLYELYR